jgi:Region found in RelA / SpoT proteins
MHPEYGSIRTLIADICSLHDSFSRDFLGIIDGNEVFNLKKKQVRNMIVDEPRVINHHFMEYLQKYHELLGRLIVNIEYEYDYMHLDFRLRIKQKDSIVNKLLHYRYGKSEEGQVALNKCLNDLLGFRIIVNDFNHFCSDFESICIELKNQYKIEHKNSTKDGYVATHVYFYGDNKYFPWELQIWNSNDANNNVISHKEHKSKRDYINWPQAYKESNEYIRR